MLASNPFEIMDLYINILKNDKKGFKTAFIMTDIFFQITIVVSTMDRKASMGAKALVGKWTYLEFPKKQYSEQGSNFESDIIAKL